MGNVKMHRTYRADLTDLDSLRALAENIIDLNELHPAQSVKQEFCVDGETWLKLCLLAYNGLTRVMK